VANNSKGALHENLSHADELVVGSDRNFGFVFTAFFVLLGVLAGRAGPESAFVRLGEALGTDGAGVAKGLFGVAALFLVSALVAPKVLHPLNVLWMKLALVLQKVVSPIVLGLLFFGVVTPMGLVLRAMGKDLLRLRLDKGLASYWIPRDPPGPKPETMTEQF
jgi:hypothetical protein